MVGDRPKKTCIGQVLVPDRGNRVKLRDVWVLPTDKDAFTDDPETT